ncbi:Similar to F-box/LRR-repeat protein 20; acc. no. Q9CZV8 [Pyronema omphalodes CBS 100304]|uniref:Similar to F-box/LRR-repeat protein 20 acc. no. Q9CZV8 n=1 Tax=Pyronema omphalodes (strain CBS 100304) TaxID=1076935 RepID=U4KUN1_PYROM|nr:Similar to F-box/LRR-repeat protein 20; acc. no. Q9CZV8 [Pyronema omphalodes CBS 100304]
MQRTNPSNTWDTSIPISRRRRLLNRIKRFSSTPSLNKYTSLDEKPQSAVSCISLAGSSSSANTSACTTPRNLSRSSSTLELFVDCPTVQETKWISLPSELKIRILSYLSPRQLIGVSSVSKEFHKLCYDGQLWSRLDASEFYDRISAKTLAHLIVTAAPFIKYINLRGCVQLPEQWTIDAVANACRNLQTAVLEDCNFQKKTVHFLLNRNPGLVSINLQGLRKISNSTCKLLGMNCPLLEELNVAFCDGLDGKGLKRIVEGCPRLRDLRANDININDPQLMVALFKANQMDRLILRGCSGMTDEYIRLFCEGENPELDPFTGRALFHRENSDTWTSNHALRYLAGRVPQLRHLDLSGVIHLTDDGLISLLPTVPKLTHLDLEDCSEIGNETLLSLASSPVAAGFQSLGVSNCENIDDAGMIAVLHKCPVLRNVEMDNTRVSDRTICAALSAVSNRVRNFVMNSEEEGSRKILPPHPARLIALSLVTYDCSSITWQACSLLMAHNASHVQRYPTSEGIPGLVLLKCFYEYQRTVDEHTSLVLRGYLGEANGIRERWEKYMKSCEEAVGRRSRRGWGRHPHYGRTGSGCSIM